MVYVQTTGGQLWTRTEGAGEDVVLIAGLGDDGAARGALAVLDGLGIAAAHVVGSGLGAVAAQELAAAAPSRVRSLILNGRWSAPTRRCADSWRAGSQPDRPDPGGGRRAVVAVLPRWGQRHAS